MNNNSGQSNIKGINYQHWVALFLFLKHSRDENFLGIRLEDPDWEDFTLIFRDKKVVCESKCYKKPLSMSVVKGILEKISKKNKAKDKYDELKDKDLIQITCPEVNSDLKLDIGWLFSSKKYNFDFNDNASKVKKCLREKGFDGDLIELASRLVFAEFKSTDYIKLLVSSFLHYHPRLQNIWIPFNQIEIYCANIVEIVASKSESSGRRESYFDKEELVNQLMVWLEDIKNNNPKYSEERTALYKQCEKIRRSVQESNCEDIEADLTEITTNPDTSFVLIDTLSKQASLDIDTWRYVLEQLFDTNMGTEILEMLLSDKSEAQMKKTIGFLSQDNNVESLAHPLAYRYKLEFLLQKFGEICQTNPDLSELVLGFLKKFLKFRPNNCRDKPNYCYKIYSDNDIENYRLSGVLYEIFNNFKNQNNTEKQQEVLEIIRYKFDWGELDDSFERERNKVLEIIRIHLDSNFIDNINQVVEYYVDRISSAMTTISSVGGHQTIREPISISQVIRPSLRNNYNEYPRKMGEYIAGQVNEFLEDPKINKSKPPFYVLQAAIPIIISELGVIDKKGWAYKILEDLQQIQKKCRYLYCQQMEIICQELNKQEVDAKKIEFIKMLPEQFLKASGLALQLVLDLAIKADEYALEKLSQLYEDEEYLRLPSTLTRIKILLEKTDKPEAINMCSEILKKYLKQVDSIDEVQRFPSDACSAIKELMYKDYQMGLSILEEMYSLQDLTELKQKIIWGSVGFDCRNRPEQNKELLQKIYQDFVVTKITGGELQSDKEKIENKFSDRYHIARFISLLADNTLFEQTMTLAKIFINDSDPTPDQDLSENFRQGHIGITTVRVYMVFTLKTIVSDPDGREYINDAVDLIDKLVSDKNKYVRMSVASTLAVALHNRHSYMPNSEERFIEEDTAQKLEDMAFDFLEKNKGEQLVLERIVDVLWQIPSISEERAKDVCRIYGLDEYKPKTQNIYKLLHFFAFKRKLFFKDVVENDPRYKKDPNEFNSDYFKELVGLSIENGDDRVRELITEAFIGDRIKDPKDFSLSLEYLQKILDRPYNSQVANLTYCFLGGCFNDHSEEYREECLAIWHQLMEKESSWSNDLESNIVDMYGGINYFWRHVNPLDVIRSLPDWKGKYVDAINLILSYSKESIYITNIEQHIKILKTINDDSRTDAILEAIREKMPTLDNGLFQQD